MKTSLVFLALALSLASMVHGQTVVFKQQGLHEEKCSELGNPNLSLSLPKALAVFDKLLGKSI